MLPGVVFCPPVKVYRLWRGFRSSTLTVYKRKTRLENGVKSAMEPASRTAPIFTQKKACTYILFRRTHKVVA